MSATARLWTLNLLRRVGVKRFRAHSAIEQPFICHIGDSNGEIPYYNRSSNCMEIVLMAAWCRQVVQPVILDVGANVGFIATQLAQLLRAQSPRVFSFEPVPFTFQRLLASVQLLGLEDCIYPICAALSDSPALRRITYSKWDSMFAQVTEGINPRVGENTAWCPALTVDQVTAVVGTPALMKLDVEGYETRVLRGASRLLSVDEALGICFESNPMTLAECESSVRELANELSRFDLFYIDDFEGQRAKFGQQIPDLNDIDWVCNVFAVPRTTSARRRWTTALAEAHSALETLPI